MENQKLNFAPNEPKSDTEFVQNQVQLYANQEDMPINQTLPSNDPNMVFTLYDINYTIIDISSFEDEIMRCQKVSIILDRIEGGCCESPNIYFHIVLRDQNYVDKYLFISTCELLKDHFFINFKKPNNAGDISNLCNGFPNTFEATKIYNKVEGCCCCEELDTTPMKIKHMGNNEIGTIAMFFDKDNRIVNYHFKDDKGVTQYQVNPIPEKTDSNCCTEFCCCSNDKAKPKKKITDCNIGNISCGQCVCCQNGNNCEFTFSHIASCEMECCQCNMETPYYPYFTNAFKCIVCNQCQPIPSEDKEQDHNYLCCLCCYDIKEVQIPVGQINKPSPWAFSDTDYDEVVQVNLHPNRKNPELRTHVPKDTLCTCYCDCCKCPKKTFSCCGCVCCSNQTKDVHCCSCSKRHFCNCCDCLCLFLSEFYSNAYESLDEREVRLEKEKKDEDAMKKKEEVKEKFLKELGIKDDKEKVIFKYVENKKEIGCCQDEKVIIDENVVSIYTPDKPTNNKARRKRVGRYVVTLYNDKEIKTDVFFPINAQFTQRIQMIFLGVYERMNKFRLQSPKSDEK